jgi:perosamine synthetase
LIPVNEPLLGDREKELLVDCIETGWISSEGPQVEIFENCISQSVNRKHGIAVANGTAALDVAVAALGIGLGDEVILPTFTIISCVLQIMRSGAKPIFVDAEPSTWNMDVNQIEDKITPATKAIMVVHIYGMPVDLDPIISLAEQFGLAIIEDAAEAIGQRYKGQPCGGFGVVSTFSFYPNKHITTGEGGMVVTDDSEIAERCRSLRNLCFQPQKRFYHEEMGWNYRMSNVQAALGVAQFEKLEQTVARKREIGLLYNDALKDMPDIQLPLLKTAYADNVFWVFGIVLDDAIDFDTGEVTKRLGEKAIGTRPFFWPLHEQPILMKKGLAGDESFPVAERIARRGFYIPSGIALKNEDIEFVSRSLIEVLA